MHISEFPAGSLIIVSGPTGSRRSTFCRELIHGSSLHDTPVWTWIDVECSWPVKDKPQDGFLLQTSDFESINAIVKKGTTFPKHSVVILDGVQGASYTRPAGKEAWQGPWLSDKVCGLLREGRKHGWTQVVTWRTREDELNINVKGPPWGIPMRIAWDADFIVRLDHGNAAIVKNRVNRTYVLGATLWDRIASDEPHFLESQ